MPVIILNKQKISYTEVSQQNPVERMIRNFVTNLSSSVGKTNKFHSSFFYFTIWQRAEDTYVKLGQTQLKFFIHFNKILTEKIHFTFMMEHSSKQRRCFGLGM